MCNAKVNVFPLLNGAPRPFTLYTFLTGIEHGQAAAGQSAKVQHELDYAATGMQSGRTINTYLSYTSVGS